MIHKSPPVLGQFGSHKRIQMIKIFELGEYIFDIDHHVRTQPTELPRKRQLIARIAHSIAANQWPKGGSIVHPAKANRPLAELRDARVSLAQHVTGVSLHGLRL